MGSGADEGACNGDGEAGFAGAGPADQDHVALICDEVARSQFAEQSLIHGRADEVEFLDTLGQR